jgi:hypothetical protein
MTAGERVRRTKSRRSGTRRSGTGGSAPGHWSRREGLDEIFEKALTDHGKYLVFAQRGTW